MYESDTIVCRVEFFPISSEKLESNSKVPNVFFKYTVMTINERTPSTF